MKCPERKAPGVIFRQPVNEPLQTGIKAIDSMSSNRKRSAWVDHWGQTNRKNSDSPGYHHQSERILWSRWTRLLHLCRIRTESFYSGQSCQNAGRLWVQCLTQPIVSASASDPAPLQFFAPLREQLSENFFRDTGRPALVIYDDLSKQVVAYREVSLLLRRPPGREAYPRRRILSALKIIGRAAKLINDEIVLQYERPPESLKRQVSLKVVDHWPHCLLLKHRQVTCRYISQPMWFLSLMARYSLSQIYLIPVSDRRSTLVFLVSRVGGNAQIKSMKKCPYPQTWSGTIQRIGGICKIWFWPRLPQQKQCWIKEKKKRGNPQASSV